MHERVKKKAVASRGCNGGRHRRALRPARGRAGLDTAGYAKSTAAPPAPPIHGRRALRGGAGAAA